MRKTVTTLLECDDFSKVALFGGHPLVLSRFHNNPFDIEYFTSFYNVFQVKFRYSSCQSRERFRAKSRQVMGIVDTIWVLMVSTIPGLMLLNE